MSNVSTGKASERIAGLLDAQSFVEIGSYVTARSTDFNLPEKETPADGVITGYGTIDGNLVYVYSQDAAVLGGSMGEMHAKKISAVYSLAMKMGAPVIGLIDCAGLRLQEGTDALQAFGGLYMNQVEASGVIPQITAVFGTCGGGMGIVPALTDFTFMEKDHAKLFVNAPNALDGNTAAKCDTASAAYQSESVGSVDATGTEAEIFEEIRNLISVLPANNEDDMSYEECTDDLNRVCADLENCAGDTSIALSMISDDNFFFETKRDFAKEMAVSYTHLGNQLVESGILEKVYELTEEDAAQIREEIVGIFEEDQNKSHAVRMAGDYGELLSNTPEVHLITNETELLQDNWWKRTVAQPDNSGQESAESGKVDTEMEWHSRYSDSWFETHALAEILFRCGSSTPDHEVKSVVKEGNVITVQISRYLIGTGAYDELPQDEMETSWNILVELDKKDVAEDTEIQVELIKEVRAR